MVDRLRDIPGVVAVALGGSRAAGTHTPKSDWDFGLYYRGAIDVDAIRSLGYPGTVVEPGEWGRLVNGGAWLTIDGQHVDLLYRDLDAVEHWLREAESGRYQRDHVEGYVAGMTTYVLAGELALNRVLHGSLPRPEFPEPLRRSAPRNWYGSAQFSLRIAAKWLHSGDVPSALGLTIKASIAAAQAILAERGEWALNEKRILERADLGQVGDRVLRLGDAAAVAMLIDDVRAVVP
ncbi:MAG: nucleotidyltransferase domain-containing protein [Candidatus Limnocylindria bacterium]